MTGRRKPERSPAPEGGQPGFEESMERLEQIVADMEGGELELEAMIERFEEGQKLIAQCTERLNEIEKKVEMLVRKGDAIEAVPFDEASAEAEPEADAPPAGRKPGSDEIEF
jgi:exodeoxyribonuclease VII small subunit